MKVSSALILASLLLGSVMAQDKAMNLLEIKIVEVLPSGSITLTVSSRSKGSIKLWDESNSWGAARWRVLRIRKGQLEVFFQNPDQRFTRNIPTSKEFAAGAQI